MGLQQGEDEGICREREPSQCVGGEKNHLTGLQVSEQNGSTTDLPVVFHRPPAKQWPRPHVVLIGLKAGGAEAGRHWCRWWSGSR
jgi:hypothetical protein